MYEVALSEALRWFMTGMLGIMGLLTVLGPRQLAAVCPYVPTRGLDPSLQERVEDAAIRRKALEDISPAYGLTVGFAWLSFAALCGAGAATPAIWYAAAFLTLSAGMAAAYLHLRRVAGRRIAVLSARTATSVVPWFWFAVAAAVTLATLVWSELRAPGWPAVAVALAALASTYLASRVATMPALLSGDDVPAERFVDEHLRFGRATAILLFAFVELFVFVMFDIGRSGQWQGNVAIALTTALAWVAYSVWTIAVRVRPQHLAL
jgi:hypothetical protein